MNTPSPFVSLSHADAVNFPFPKKKGVGVQQLECAAIS